MKKMIADEQVGKEDKWRVFHQGKWDQEYHKPNHWTQLSLTLCFPLFCG